MWVGICGEAPVAGGRWDMRFDYYGKLKLVGPKSRNYGRGSGTIYDCAVTARGRHEAVRLLISSDHDGFKRAASPVFSMISRI